MFLFDSSILEMSLVDIPRFFQTLLVQKPDLDSVFDNGKHNNTGIKISQIIQLHTTLTPVHCIHSLNMLPVEGRGEVREGSTAWEIDSLWSVPYRFCLNFFNTCVAIQWTVITRNRMPR